MITNERQYEHTRAQVARFHAEILEAETRPASKKRDMVVAGMRAQIAPLEAALHAYEQLKASGGRDFSAPLKDLGEMLTQARVARGWLQKELAQKLDVAVGTIERYEKNDYTSASLMTVLDAARVLGLEVDCKGSMAKLDAFPELTAFTTKKAASAKR